MPKITQCDFCKALMEFEAVKVSYGYGSEFFDGQPDQFFCNEKCLRHFLEEECT